MRTPYAPGRSTRLRRRRRRRPGRRVRRPGRCSRQSVTWVFLLSWNGFASLGGPRVQRVAHAVPQEVEGEHREDERRPGEGEVPPGRAEDRGGLGDHLAPAGLWRVDADAEVREGRLEQDVLRDDERRVD